MSATIIDGKAIARDIRTQIKNHVAVLKSDHGITPTLNVILVGDDPASEIYVRNKESVAGKAGINSTVHRLPKKTSQDELLALIHTLNADKKIHGILVQLPLPRQIDTATVLKAIDPKKDVDGLHIENAGRLALGMTGIVPCTPMGCLLLIRRVCAHMAGKHAVVIGGSNLVGKPMAQLLLRDSCTVTMAHSRTHDLAGLCRDADIIVAATGRPRMVKKDWIKPGAIVIDVGITRADDGEIVGDVDFDAVSTVAGYITPVPGGVGPMTIACLLYNTLTAACREAELTVPELR